MLNPLGIINDGLMELTFMKGICGFGTGLTLFHGAKSGGLQFYDKKFQCYRCKKVKLSNLKIDKNGEKMIQDINIDGEDHEFRDFAMYEVMPSELEIIVDLDNVIKKTYLSQRSKRLCRQPHGLSLTKFLIKIGHMLVWICHIPNLIFHVMKAFLW